MDFVTSLLPRADEELVHSPYGYVPTRYVAIIFIVLFSLSTRQCYHPYTYRSRILELIAGIISSRPYRTGQHISDMVVVPNSVPSWRS